VIPTQTSLSINSAPLTHASIEKQITVIDCPGHPRLAHLLRQSLAQTSPRGVILLIDAASVNKDLNSVANMVYSTLLALPRPIHVLIVANKSDLFTALPVNKVRELLEGEISSLKKTRDEGMDEDEERTTLGGVEFKFDELENEGVVIEWTRGSIEARKVAGVLEWISKRVA
jgi:signal recognition particle receptor subunit beta